MRASLDREEKLIRAAFTAGSKAMLAALDEVETVQGCLGSEATFRLLAFWIAMHPTEPRRAELIEAVAEMLPRGVEFYRNNVAMPDPIARA
jgi:hypothetical protein